MQMMLFWYQMGVNEICFGFGLFGSFEDFKGLLAILCNNAMFDHLISYIFDKFKYLKFFSIFLICNHFLEESKKFVLFSNSNSILITLFVKFIIFFVIKYQVIYHSIDIKILFEKKVFF
jgi:hypothetical protein